MYNGAYVCRYMLMGKNNRHKTNVAKQQLHAFSRPISEFFNLKNDVLLYWKDSDSIYYGSNDFFAELITCATYEMVGITDHDFTKITSQADSFQANDQQVINDNTTGMFIEHGDYKNNNAQTVLSFKTPLTDSANHTVGVFGMSFPLDQDNFAKTTNLITQLGIITCKPLLTLPNNVIKKKHPLTNREKECIYHLIRGMTAKEIAQKLAISYRTVEKHLDNVKEKLHCKTRSELIRTIIDSGLLI
jgi:DNA-binding CsgD family transcriptional regulator